MPTMKASLYDGNGVMNVVDFPRPEAGPGDAIVRVTASGICGTDLHRNTSGAPAEDVPRGHEVAGEVVEVGDGVDPRMIGQRVAIDIHGHGRACTRCWYCRIGQYYQCLDRGPSEGGGFAEYIRRKVIGCYVMPDNLSWEEGALVEPFAVGIHGVRRGQLVGGEIVAVLGAGTIGLTTIAASRALGAGRVLVTARHEHQAVMAKRLGADNAFSPDGPAFLEAVAEATGGRGADLTIETVGGSSEVALKQALDVTRRQGRVVVLGLYRRPMTVDLLSPLFKEQSIIFSACYSILDGRHDYEIAIDLMASGKVPLKELVTHTFPLEDIQKGFDTAYDKATGSIKVQIHQVN